MSPRLPEYLAATRHPWACVLFVLPLLFLYEAHRQLGGAVAGLSGGADVWVRDALGQLGLTAPFAAPLLLVALLLAWGLCRPAEEVDDPLGTGVGMILESGGFAVLLFGLVQIASPFLANLADVLQDPLARILSTSTATAPEATGELILRYMGAGIYEEAIFRLLLFSTLRLLLRAGDFPRLAATALAAVVSALLFAAAHHLGAGTESFDVTVFLYRTLAGLYFAYLFALRGFGIAVGAHAGYDVLVGLILR